MSESFTRDLIDGICSFIFTIIAIIGIVWTSLQAPRDINIVILAIIFWLALLVISIVFLVKTLMNYLAYRKTIY